MKFLTSPSMPSFSPLFRAEETALLRRIREPPWLSKIYIYTSPLKLSVSEPNFDVELWDINSRWKRLYTVNETFIITSPSFIINFHNPFIAVKLVEEEEKEEKVRLGILYVSIRRGSERGIAVHAMIGRLYASKSCEEWRKEERKEGKRGNNWGIEKGVSLKSCSSI